MRGSPRPETGRKVGGGQGEGRGSVRVREGTIQDGAVGEGAEELADELDGGGRHGRGAQGGRRQSETEKRQNQWIFLITEKKTIGGVPEKAPFGL